MSTWNGNRFSVYKSDEKQVLGLLEELGNQVNDNTDNKTDKLGDHAGTWQGISKPTLSNEGLAGTVEKHEDDINGIMSQLAEMTYNVKKYGAKGDGITDDTQSIKDAIAEAFITGGIVLLPAGRYKIIDVIIIPEGVKLSGVVTPFVWTTRYTGSILEYYGTGIAVQLSNDVNNMSGMGIENIRILDVNGTGETGLKVGGNIYWSHELTLLQVTTVGFNTGIKIDKAYGISAILVKSAQARSHGWHLTDQIGGLTLSTFTSCGGYSAGENGWLIERRINYSVFEQCYFDGCKIGFKMTGYTPNKNLFKNCGVENYTEYAFYLSNPLMIVGLSAPTIINTKSTVVDNIYFSGVSLSLTNVYMPSEYSPLVGYDVNIASGRAICNDVDVNKLNGLYDGAYKIQGLYKLGYASDLELTMINVPSGTGSYSIDVRRLKNIKGSSVGNRRVIFTQPLKGQTLKIYGYDDLNKFFLDNFDLPKLPFDFYLGKGDFVELVYDNLDDSGDAWHVIDYKINRVGAIPTTGYWEVGRMFYHPTPTANGVIGWICTVAGTPGTWKTIGTIGA